MERAFLITKQSKYYKNYENIANMVIQQKKFVRKFFQDNNIGAERFYVSGDGYCNCAFEEYSKKNIRLAIIPTENDLRVYGNQLTKADENGLCRFRANSIITKIFAQECVENGIVINIIGLDLRDYLKSLDWMGYSSQRVLCNEGIYLKVASDLLKKDDNPEGFIPIKLSEFYKALEKYDSEE